MKNLLKVALFILIIVLVNLFALPDSRSDQIVAQPNGDGSYTVINFSTGEMVVVNPDGRGGWQWYQAQPSYVRSSLPSLPSLPTSYSQVFREERRKVPLG